MQSRLNNEKSITKHEFEYEPFPNYKIQGTSFIRKADRYVFLLFAYRNLITMV